MGGQRQLLPGTSPVKLRHRRPPTRELEKRVARFSEERGMFGDKGIDDATCAGSPHE